MDMLKDAWNWLLSVFKSWYGWVGASATAGIVGFGQGMGWWDSPGKRIYVGLLVVGFVISMFQAWRYQYRARLAADQVPTEMKVRIENFHHRPATGDAGEKLLHLFIKASVELLKPKNIKVSYKLSLIFPNATTTQAAVNDIELWGMRVQSTDSSGTTTSVMIDYRFLDPMRDELVAGDKKEGWLHFIFKAVPTAILQTACIRLTALTPNAGNHDECLVLDARWPLVGRAESIVKQRTEEWFTLPEQERRIRLGRFGEYGQD